MPVAVAVAMELAVAAAPVVAALAVAAMETQAMEVQTPEGEVAAMAGLAEVPVVQVLSLFAMLELFKKAPAALLPHRVDTLITHSQVPARIRLKG